MIRVFESIPNKLTPSGTYFVKFVIASKHYGKGNNVIDAVNNLLLDGDEVSSGVKDVLYDSYNQVFCADDILEILEWAKQEYPEQFV